MKELKPCPFNTATERCVLCKHSEPCAAVNGYKPKCKYYEPKTGQTVTAKEVMEEIRMI